MKESARLVDRAQEPTAVAVTEWIGAQNAKRWAALCDFIEREYPGVFNVEWLYGGRKHGWTLRFKKSKSFCTFIPERGRFRVLLVFGEAEREKVESELRTLVSHVRRDYRQSTTYHDGKWLFTTVDNASALKDVMRLLELKRRPALPRRRSPLIRTVERAGGGSGG